MESLSSDEDDDLILQFSNRPPRFTQNSTTNTISNAPGTSQNPHEEQNASQTTSAVSHELNSKLNEAQGEASMLRDKIKFINTERDREKKAQLETINEIKNEHLNELEKLKQTVQKLEDEKKFLVLESKSSPSLSRTRRATQVSSSNQDTLLDTTASPIVKKRRIEDIIPRRNLVQLNYNKKTPDETGELFDAILGHRLFGSDMTTMEILNRINLKHIKNFCIKTLSIKSDESIGKSLTKLFLQCKQSMSLDRFIDTALESIALLIKEILFCKEESSIAIPFLVALMHQCIIFRPSAVPVLSLKDLFIFISDLIKAFQHVLKQSLHVSPLKLDVEPQIFQYEFIEVLITCYSFDLLETSIKILQIQPPEQYIKFFDDRIVKLLDFIYKLALTMSYIPVLNVIFNVVEILETVSSMFVVINSNEQNPTDADWWKDCITRLYLVFEKDFKRNKGKDLDMNSLYNFKFYDCHGLVNNIGDNTLGKLISSLIHKDRLQALPRVISKDDIPATTDFNVDLKHEQWLIRLKIDILNIFENLLILYPLDLSIGNDVMFTQLTRLMAKEQENMLERYIGQDTFNLRLKVYFIEQILTVLYKLWREHNSQLREENLRKIDNELIMALWRVVVSQVERNTKDDIKDHRHLIDKMYELQLTDEKTYYEDAFEDIPEYIENDLISSLEETCTSLMQIKYKKIYQEMARYILETRLGGFGSITETDSLYMAMGI